MTNKTLADREFDRKLINQLFDELNAEYHSMQKELAQYFSNEDDTPFDNITLCDAYLAGFATQIKSDGHLSNLNLAMGNDGLSLNSIGIFQSETIRNFFLSPDNPCVITKRYIERMDYLRLLLIDYCENYLVKKEDAS